MESTSASVTVVKEATLLPPTDSGAEKQADTAAVADENNDTAHGAALTASSVQSVQNETAPLEESKEAVESSEVNDEIRPNTSREPSVKPSTNSVDKQKTSIVPTSLKDAPTTKKRGAVSAAVALPASHEPVESARDGSSEPNVDVTRPVKRARTAYFIFSEERRAHVQQQHPGEGVAVVARSLGQLWNALTTDEKATYQQQAALEREHVAAATEAWKKAAGSHVVGSMEAVSHMSTKDNPSQLIFPVARIRKIAKLDPDVRGLSKEALLLITKVAELATAKLGVECVRMATIQNRRKLLPEDVAHVCGTREQFMFLREDIVDLVRTQAKDTATTAAAAAGTKKSSKAAPKENAKNGQRLTDFFKAAS